MRRLWRNRLPAETFCTETGSAQCHLYIHCLYKMPMIIRTNGHECGQHYVDKWLYALSASYRRRIRHVAGRRVVLMNRNFSKSVIVLLLEWFSKCSVCVCLIGLSGLVGWLMWDKRWLSVWWSLCCVPGCTIWYASPQCFGLGAPTLYTPPTKRLELCINVIYFGSVTLNLQQLYMYIYITPLAESIFLPKLHQNAGFCV